MDSAGSVLMPGGGRDLLPGDTRRKLKLESALRRLFDSWGYQEVVTPTFEYYEVLAPALGEMVRHDQLYRFIDDHGQIMVLRPDMTTPIARMVSSRLRGEGWPRRFCYLANVFRRENKAGRQREFYQAGVELLGAVGPEADTEVVYLAGEALGLALSLVGIRDFRITIGHVGVLGGVLNGAGFTIEEQEQAKLALSKKDLVSWQRLICSSRLDSEKKELLASLPEMHDGIAVLDRVETLPLDQESREGVSRIRQIWRNLQGCGFRENIGIDLTLLRGLEYYTGMVFEGYAPGVGYPLCGGGRYDNLLARFGYPCPATGFALGIERILSSLETEMRLGEQETDYFVTGSDQGEVFKKAREIRESGLRVEVDVTGLPGEEAISYASRKGIPHIIVLD